MAHVLFRCERGSPGGPKAIASLVLIVAEDLQQRGVDSGAETAEAKEKPKAGTVTVATSSRGGGGGRGALRGGRGGRSRGRGRAAFQARYEAAYVAEQPDEQTENDSDVIQATAVELVHKPTALERAADPNDLKIIRDLYGSRAQTLINILLSFDGYFNWYYPLEESIPFMAPRAQRVERALDNCRLAIDMCEIFERVTIRSHGSFLPHGAIFNVLCEYVMK